jgi:murein DD-endopeptidase MepM/ murein hydrolase activator NlpD
LIQALIQVERLRALAQAWFPERHLYLRQGGEMQAYVLTGRKQMMITGGLAGAALWMGVCTASMMIDLAGRAESPPRQTQAAVQLRDGAPSAAVLAAEIERRHAALALLLADASSAPGAAQALTPPIAQGVSAGPADPMRRLQAVQTSQERVLAATTVFAAERTERLRDALRMAGIDPTASARTAGPSGGPLIEADDPQALATALPVDPAFARRVRDAAGELANAHALASTAARLPIAAPTTNAYRTSGYGFRLDPFTGRAAFHPGLDFAGPRMTPVRATAAGAVTFSGQRAGYGRVVEVDHGGGFKTRYAHLASIAVRPGQVVAAGDRLGGMGSTGRSTGTHLHYEVWLNGRAQNPERFVRAGGLLAGG